MQFYRIGQDPVPTSLTNQSLTFPWYDSTYLNSTTPVVQLGSRWGEAYGKGVFQQVQAGANLVAGQLVALAAPLTDTVVSASSSVQVLALNSGGLTVNSLVGSMVFIGDVSGTVGLPVSRPIKANTASTITVSLTTSILGNNKPDPDVLPNIPQNNTPLTITRPFRVRVCTAALQPVGVALGTVTSGNYTFIQIAGYVHIITGPGADTVVGVPAVPEAAGIVVGSGGTANVYTAGGAIIPLSVVSGGPEQAPYEVNFSGA